MPDRTPVPTRPPGHPSRRRLGLVLGAVLVVLASPTGTGRRTPGWWLSRALPPGEVAEVIRIRELVSTR